MRPLLRLTANALAAAVALGFEHLFSAVQRNARTKPSDCLEQESSSFWNLLDLENRWNPDVRAARIVKPRRRNSDNRERVPIQLQYGALRLRISCIQLSAHTRTEH